MVFSEFDGTKDESGLVESIFEVLLLFLLLLCVQTGTFHLPNAKGIRGDETAPLMLILPLTPQPYLTFPRLPN